MFELVLLLLARWLRLPPAAAALIVGGMALALIPGERDVVLDPDLTLVLFLRRCCCRARSSRRGGIFGRVRRSGVGGRTQRHPGYAVSQRIRKRIEEVFGWV